MYYGPDILIEAGVNIDGYSKKQAAVLLNIPLTGINMIMSIVSCFLIDKFGRRYLLLRTLPVAVVGWLLVSLGMGV